MKIKIHEGKNEWRKAGETYSLLLKTYFSARREDYISDVEEAIGLFCKRFWCKEKDGASRNQQ